MRTRLIVGLSGLAVLLPSVIFGGELAVMVIVGLAMLVGAREHANMAFPEDASAATVWLAAGLAALFATVLFARAHLHQVVSLLVAATFIFVVLRPGLDLRRAADALGRYFIGFAWIGLLLNLVLLRQLDDGLAWCFVVLGISFLGDTGAYFAGKNLGKTKLYERVSPNKTVEGAIGGIVCSTVGVFVITWIGLPGKATLLDCILLGVLGCIAGILGDLGESLLKRAFGVKDTGTIMPGHGGILDRVDSVLFVGTAVYLYVSLVKVAA